VASGVALDVSMFEEHKDATNQAVGRQTSRIGRQITNVSNRSGVLLNTYVRCKGCLLVRPRSPLTDGGRGSQGTQDYA
jgi:hypothetical protein